MAQIYNILGRFIHAVIVFIGVYGMFFWGSATSAILYGSDYGGGFDPIFKNGHGIEGGAEELGIHIDQSNTGIAEDGSLMDSVIFAIKYILIFAGVIAILVFLYAGFRYIFSFGDDVDGAKEAMINAVIGIVIILFSWIIIQFLISFDL